MSAISGYAFGGTGGGARDPARLGEFMIPGLPPGSYTGELQPLQDMPVERVPPAYLPGGPKFWHEPSMTHDAPAAATPIVVNAGQEVSGIDIGVNAEDLGAPAAVMAQGTSALPNAQKVTQVALGTGWYLLSEYLTGEPLPATLELGSIGAGGAGAFIGWIERVRGNAVPSITLHGTYTDDAGVTSRF